MFDQIKHFVTYYCQRIGLPNDWLSTVDFWIYLSGLSSGVLLSLFFYIVKAIKWIRLRRKQRLLERDLHPWYTPAEIDWATRFYVPTQYQNVSPSQDDEPGRKFIASARNPLIPLFLKKAFGKTGDDNKYYLILADSGMGKSTFMINLYLAYKRKWHFFQPKFKIKLLPLGHPHALEELDNMDDKEKEGTILLLDAFDEDVQALHNYQKRMEEILQKSWRFREVVITCRTQFFPSREEEPHETGYYKFGGDGGDFKFQKLYLSVFDDKDVWRYLLKRYNIFNPFRWKQLYKAWRITKKSPNLVVRPMLLSHIEDLVNENREYEYAHQIYEVLIKKWIQRESKKPGIREKYGSVEVFQEKLESFSRHLAIDMYKNREARGGLFIPKDQTIFSDTGVGIEELFEKPGVAIKDSEWRTRSLLNRNAEGQYKFAHKSILEYFLAKEAFRDQAFGTSFRFQGMDAAKGFCNKMIIQALNCVDGSFTLLKSKTIYPLSKLNQKNFAQVSNVTIKSIEGIPIIMLENYLPKNISSITIFDKKNLSSYYTLTYLPTLLYQSSQKVKMTKPIKRKKHPEIFVNPEMLKIPKHQDIMALWKHLLLIELPELLEHIGVHELEMLGEQIAEMEQKRLLKILSIKQYIEEEEELKELQNQLKANGEWEFLKKLVLMGRSEVQRWPILQGYMDVEQIIEDLRFEKNLKLKSITKWHEILEVLGWQKVFEFPLQRLLTKITRKDPIILAELQATNEFIKQCKKLQEAMPNTKIYY